MVIKTRYYVNILLLLYFAEYLIARQQEFSEESFIDTIEVYVKNDYPSKNIVNWFGNSQIYGWSQRYLLYSGKYGLAVWQTDDNEYKVRAYKFSFIYNPDTIYLLSTDTAIVTFDSFGQWPQGLDDHYLLMDLGCCPGVRTLMIIDLALRDTILNIGYTDIVEYDSVRTLKYYAPFRKATKADTDRYDEIIQNGNTPYIEQLYSFNLDSRIKKGLGKFRLGVYD
jgi:hypothetical protein